MKNRAARRIAFLAASLAGCWLLIGCASGHREPYTGQEPSVRNVADFEIRLRHLTDASSRLELLELGRVEYGEFRAPLWVVRFRARTGVAPGVRVRRAAR